MMKELNLVVHEPCPDVQDPLSGKKIHNDHADHEDASFVCRNVNIGPDKVEEQVDLVVGQGPVA